MPDGASIDPLAAVAVLRSETQNATPFRFVGRPVRMPFGQAATRTEVLHLLAEIPDGFLMLDTDAGATIIREPGVQWTKDLAYLRASVVGNVTLVFFTLREAPINVQAHA